MAVLMLLRKMTGALVRASCTYVKICTYEAQCTVVYTTMYIVAIFLLARKKRRRRREKKITYHIIIPERHLDPQLNF